MKILRAVAVFIAVGVAIPLFGEVPHAGGSRVALATSSFGAQQFRTDINPALRYYQAFLEMPNLPEAEHQDLFAREWRGQPLNKRFGELVSRYDIEFRFLREAAYAQVPCDWGIDLTEGPDALLPGLARAKNAAQVTRFRVMWHLQNGRQAEARDDLLAAFTLARNVSRDGVLVSAMVQMASENLLEAVVAENFFQWPPETLQQIVDGFDALITDYFLFMRLTPVRKLDRNAPKMQAGKTAGAVRVGTHPTHLTPLTLTATLHRRVRESFGKQTLFPLLEEGQGEDERACARSAHWWSLRDSRTEKPSQNPAKIRPESGQNPAKIRPALMPKALYCNDNPAKIRPKRGEGGGRFFRS